MVSATVVEQSAFAGFHVNGVDVALNGACLVRGDDDGFCLLVESNNLHHHPLPARELLDDFAVFRIAEVQVVVSVALALHDVFRSVPRQELDGVQRLHIFGMRFAVELGNPLPCDGVVAHEPAVVLVAVQLEHVNSLGVGAPGDVSEIAIGGVASIQIDGLLRLQVVDAHGHLMARFACHWIFVGFVRSHPRVDVHLRIVGNHRLVHTIEGQPLPVGAPESSLLNAKLIAVDALSVDDFARPIGG